MPLPAGWERHEDIHGTAGWGRHQEVEGCCFSEGQLHWFSSSIVTHTLRLLFAEDVATVERCWSRHCWVAAANRHLAKTLEQPIKDQLEILQTSLNNARAHNEASNITDSLYGTTSGNQKMLRDAIAYS